MASCWPHTTPRTRCWPTHAALQLHGRVHTPWSRYHVLTAGRTCPWAWRGVEVVPREELMVEEHHLVTLEVLAPAGPCYLDPGHEQGKWFESWNLVVPERVVTRSWEDVL